MEKFFDREEIFALENFLYQGQIVACGKLSSFWTNLCLWKKSLIMGKSLLVESVLDQENVFDGREVP